MIAIDAFEVAARDDDRFRAYWTPYARGAVLHRALRDDVPLRFVAVTRVEATRPPPDVPFETHPGIYEIAFEEGDVDGDGGVILINLFEVAPADDERVLAGWKRARDALAEQHGYLGTRLHRSERPADFRLVNIARWSSPLMFARALDTREVKAAGAAMQVRSHPGLYERIDG